MTTDMLVGVVVVVVVLFWVDKKRLCDIVVVNVVVEILDAVVARSRARCAERPRIWYLESTKCHACHAATKKNASGARVTTRKRERVREWRPF